MIIPWMGCFDMANLLSFRSKPLETSLNTSDDYTIIVPIFKNPQRIKNIDYLRKYKEKVILCTVQNENSQMSEFVTEMRNEGFFVLSLPRPSGEYFKEALLKEALPFSKSKYICFLDADSIPEDNVGKVCGVMEEKSLDLASVNIVPNCNSNWIEKIQKTEYSMSMLSHQYQPWLTSGACLVGKSSVLSEIMDKHSLYFAGGDIEIGVLAKRSHKKIGFVNFKVFTEVPKGFKSWFKQRANWFCGAFRLSVINADKVLLGPLSLVYSLFYSLVFVFLLLPLKFYSLSVEELWLFGAILLLYIPITIAANWKVRSKNMLIYPFYAAFQVFVLSVAGIAQYFWVLKKYKMIGRMKK